MIKIKERNMHQKGYSKNAQWMVNYFKDKDVFIVGGGPSLDDFDFKKLDNKNTIVINHAYRYCKTDVLVFLDAIFVREIKKEFNHDIYDFKFKIIAGPSSGLQERANITKVQVTRGISMMPDRLYGRPCSTFIAMNAAIIMDARRIFLLGIDGAFKKTKKFPKGKGHFFSHEFKHNRDHYEAAYIRMVPLFEKFKHFKNIYNCSPISTIKFFKYMDIEEALCGQE